MEIRGVEFREHRPSDFRSKYVDWLGHPTGSHIIVFFSVQLSKILTPTWCRSTFSFSLEDPGEEVGQRNHSVLRDLATVGCVYHTYLFPVFFKHFLRTNEKPHC